MIIGQSENCSEVEWVVSDTFEVNDRFDFMWTFLLYNLENTLKGDKNG